MTIPETQYPEKAASMADLIQRLHAAPPRLAAAIEGLADEEMHLAVVPDEKTILECVEHASLVSLGWTNMFYEAVEDVCVTPRTTNKDWQKPLEAMAKESAARALEVYTANNATVAAFLASLGEDNFRRGFKPVAFLTEPFQINESINWGLVIHCDWHLAQIHLKRKILGKPLEWMAVYMERYPQAIKDHQVPPGAGQGRA